MISLIIINLLLILVAFRINFLLRKKAVSWGWLLSTEIKRWKSNNHILDFHSDIRQQLVNNYKYSPKIEMLLELKDRKGLVLTTTDLCESRDRLNRRWFGVILRRKEPDIIVFHSNYDVWVNEKNSTEYKLIGISCPK